MDPYAAALSRLLQADIRFVIIGVAGANYYAAPGQTLFSTRDRDLFLPAEPENLLRCWQLLEEEGWELWAGNEPLDRPRDLWLAEQVVARKAAVKATRPEGLELDLTLVMAGFDFEEVWQSRRDFQNQEAEFPVASLLHIVESKRQAGRPKDLLFLSTHQDVLEELFRRSKS